MLLLFCLCFVIIFVQNTWTFECEGTSKEEFCIETDYDSNKIPPNIPLNVDMTLFIHVSFKYF